MEWQNLPKKYYEENSFAEVAATTTEEGYTLQKLQSLKKQKSKTLYITVY